MRDATTVTPATAGAELLDRLRALLDRQDAVSTLEDVRALADEVTAALRSTRGRITRLARQAAAASKPPAPKPTAPKAEPIRTRPPAPGIATRAVASCRAVAQGAVRLVGRAIGAAVRRARTILSRTRHDTVAPVVQLPTPRRDAVERPETAPPPRPSVEEDPPMAAVPDLNAEQAAGLACIECGVDFWTTHTLKVPAGVSESTGEVVWACVGACARQAGHREPVGEQMELLP